MLLVWKERVFKTCLTSVSDRTLQDWKKLSREEVNKLIQQASKDSSKRRVRKRKGVFEHLETEMVKRRKVRAELGLNRDRNWFIREALAVAGDKSVTDDWGLTETESVKLSTFKASSGWVEKVIDRSVSES